MGCPDDEEFATLLSHGLDARRRAEIVDHAAGCASCRVLISELATSETRSSKPDAGPDDAEAASRSGYGAIARSVASALFAYGRHRKIGRYQLLEIVGAGGMGVVWGAWDPELARRVALKLVHPRMEAARERILAEGQALARLSHPNVVPVYDVGVIEEHVYLVMEWVQGETLGAYAGSGVALRDLVDAYRQAGAGLAAAHRAGLVHRDFKPANAIRGDDGRVRILDFGLARSDDEAGAAGVVLAGTPRYMAPEQAAGESVTPAADQYAFALSLREAVTRVLDRAEDAGRRPSRPGSTSSNDRAAPVSRSAAASREAASEPARIPTWLARIVARGTAAAAADRFASMEELLAALARDPARIWRRRAIAAAAGALAVAAFVIGLMITRPPETCVGSAAEIANSWNPAARTQVVGHLRELGAFGAAEADRLAGELDGYRAAWTTEHRRACLAHERGELPESLYAQRLGCLARGKAALATARELMTSVSADGLSGALVAAHSLPSAPGCAAAEAQLVSPPPAAVAARVAAVEPTIERARLLGIAAHPDAMTAALASVTAAEPTGYAPLVARALIVQGRAEIERHLEDAAQRTLERAVDLALRSGDDVAAIEAYARLVFVVGRARGDVTDNWSAMAAIAARTGAPGRFARALLYNNKAIARLAGNDRAGARSLLLQAQAAASGIPIDEVAPRKVASSTALAQRPSSAGPMPEVEIELAYIPQNLALVTDDLVERDALASQVVNDLERLLGPHHASTLKTRTFAAMLLRDPAAAAAQYELACDGMARWYPAQTKQIQSCAYERGWLADARGDTAVARAAMQTAAGDPATRDPDDDDAIIAAGYLAITGGADPDSAASKVERRTSAPPASPPDAGTPSLAAVIAALEALAVKDAAAAGWWNHSEAADAYVAAALGWDHLERPGEADRCWRAALALLETVHHPMAERRLARVRLTLARRPTTPPDDARRLAAGALAWYRSAAGYDAEIAALSAVATAPAGSDWR